MLTLSQGLAVTVGGDTAPLTGESVSTPRYRLHRKVNNSPGLLAAPSGVMPPPSVNNCANWFPWTVKVP